MLGAAVLSATLAADAPAYRADPNVIPQPVLRYYVGLSDWKKPFARVVKALNRAHVGTRLVRAKIPEQASIQVGRLNGTRCGYPGVQGITQSLRGGYAALYLPRGCHGAAASGSSSSPTASRGAPRRRSPRCWTAAGSPSSPGWSSTCR